MMTHLTCMLIIFIIDVNFYIMLSFTVHSRFTLCYIVYSISLRYLMMMLMMMLLEEWKMYGLIVL